MKFIQEYNGYNIWQRSDGTYEAWKTTAFLKGFTRADTKIPVGKGVNRYVLAAKNLGDAMNEINAIRKKLRPSKKERVEKRKPDPNQLKIE